MKIFLVLILMVVISVSGSLVSADTKIDHCMDIQNSGSYYLDKDIYFQHSSRIECLVVYNVNDVIIDGRGHSIIHTGSNYHDTAVTTTHARNITVKNLVLKDFDYGFIVISRDTYILNNTVINAIIDDAYTFNGADNITFEKNTFGTGILLYGNNINFKNNKLTVAYIQIKNSANDSFVLNTIDGSKRQGTILFINPINVSNITFEKNTFNKVSLSPQNSTFFVYNNIFNNYFNVGSQTIYLNTTRRNGKNIIQGDIICGNYYHKSDFTGFSDTCKDLNKDWICDNSYYINQNNIDSCALKKPRYYQL